MGEAALFRAFHDRTGHNSRGMEMRACALLVCASLAIIAIQGPPTQEFEGAVMKEGNVVLTVGR